MKYIKQKKIRHCTHQIDIDDMMCESRQPF
jgi:hypothetical protein